MPFGVICHQRIDQLPALESAALGRAAIGVKHYERPVRLPGTHGQTTRYDRCFTFVYRIIAYPDTIGQPIGEVAQLHKAAAAPEAAEGAVRHGIGARAAQ